MYLACNVHVLVNTLTDLGGGACTTRYRIRSLLSSRAFLTLPSQKKMASSTGRLIGKVVFITGAAQGIGKAMALVSEN